MAKNTKQHCCVKNIAKVKRLRQNLQIVEHDFRDLKSDNICIRPIYHRNEAQTIGHIQVCFYALIILKELENHIFPVLHEMNKQRAAKLSFNDLIAELTKIKMCELKTQVSHPHFIPINQGGSFCKVLIFCFLSSNLMRFNTDTILLIYSV